MVLRMVFREFLRSVRGNITMIAALVLPVCVMMAGGAIDLVRSTTQKTDLQRIADAVALAGAGRLSLAGANAVEIRSYVLNEIDRQIKASPNNGNFTRDVKVSLEENSVTAWIDQKTAALFLSHLLSENVRVESEAVMRGQIKLCALALSDNSDAAINMGGSSTLEANECSLFSNSTSPTGIVADKDATLTADFICTAGGYSGDGANFSVEVTTDCPPFKDPLADNPPTPGYGACDFHDHQVGAIKVNPAGKEVKASAKGLLKFNKYGLDPGVYCGGIEILDLADLTLQPGIYIIKDGPLSIGYRAIISGEGVSFFFTGDNAILDIGRDAALDLSAPVNGQMAGILFMDDPSIAPMRTHSIRSANARNLLGTFYFPDAKLSVDTDRPIADQSAYTIIVADEIELLGRPSLYLNSDYAATNVPVPAGIGPIGGQTILRR